MNEVIVYVEGRSDQLAMENLLSGLIAEKRLKGIAIKFFEAPRGDKKKRVCFIIPERAVNIVLNKPNTIVIAMPDFYPPCKGINHDTPALMMADIHALFVTAVSKKTDNPPADISDRFKVFCFKHDLESLVLAAHESFNTHLAPCSPPSWDSWTKPVENQNHDTPPKMIVSKLFSECKKRYTETIDTPAILGKADYKTLAERCPQQFSRFVDYLESL